jgi:hypothetical protein
VHAFRSRFTLTSLSLKVCGITLLKITFVWGVTPCILVDREQTTVRHISEEVSLHLPEDWGFVYFVELHRCDCLFCGGKCVEGELDDETSASTLFVS